MAKTWEPASGNKWHKEQQRTNTAQNLQVGKILISDLKADAPVSIEPLHDKSKRMIAQEGCYAYLIDTNVKTERKIYVRGPCEYVQAADKYNTLHPWLPVHRGTKILMGGELFFDKRGCLTKWNNGSGNFPQSAEVAFETGLPMHKFEPVKASITEVYKRLKAQSGQPSASKDTKQEEDWWTELGLKPLGDVDQAILLERAAEMAKLLAQVNELNAVMIFSGQLQKK